MVKTGIWSKQVYMVKTGDYVVKQVTIWSNR